jgi:hypothetical protein
MISWYHSLHDWFVHPGQGWDVWRQNLEAHTAGAPFVTPIDPVHGY